MKIGNGLCTLLLFKFPFYLFLYMLGWKKSEGQCSSMFAFHGGLSSFRACPAGNLCSGGLSRFRACPAGDLCSGECTLHEETEKMELEQPGVDKGLDLPVHNRTRLLARFNSFILWGCSLHVYSL